MPPIHIHPILMVFIGIAFVTGTFMELAIILAIVLIHELGHYLAAMFFKWRVRGIMLWVFGGVMDTDEHGTRPVYEEMIVTAAGPLQHVVIYGAVLLLSDSGFVPASVLSLIIYYNTAILIFNLLPVWPLDGGKLLFLCLSSFLPYQRAYHTAIMASIVISLVLLAAQFMFWPFTLSAFLLMIFLVMENRSEWKHRYFVFIRFLLNRYEGNANVRGVKPIVVPAKASLMQVFAQFQREKRHPIYITFPDSERQSIDENDCLRSYFHDKAYSKTVGELAAYQT